jgi:acetolactate synthase-1/2/3 large subunit
MKIAANVGLARILKAEGVEWVSTFPVCHVNNTLAQEGIPLLMMRDERFAVAVADAFSRVTNGRRIGVCTVMGGINPAGAQMAYGALAQAYEDSSPMLCLTDGLPEGSDGQIRYDLESGLRSVAKWVGHIRAPQQVAGVMRQAFTQLRTGRPGPVIVTIRRGLGEYDEEEHPYAPVTGWRSVPSSDDVTSAVRALLAAKRPLLYVGEGVLYAQACEALRQFAERAQAPVLTTLKAKGAFPENHPFSVGVRGELAAHFLRACDLVLAIGVSLSVGHFRQTIPDPTHKTLIHCTNDSTDINRVYRTAHALVGDAALCLQALNTELAEQAGVGLPPNDALVAEIRAAKEAMLARYRPLLASDETPINPYRVYGDLQKVLDPARSLVSPDSGNTRDQTSTIYEALTPRGFVGWGNVSTLGFGLAAAVAGRLAHPDWQCVNITGDAGIGYMIGNLEALVRHGIGVTTVYINNGGFAGYGPGFWGAGHDPYTCQVLDHAVADWSEAVKRLGYYAEHITEPKEIIPALQRALAANAQGRPALLEFICCQYPVFGAWVTGP